VTGTNIGYGAYRPTYKFKTARAAGDPEPYTIAVTAEFVFSSLPLRLSAAAYSPFPIFHSPLPLLLYSLGLMGHDGLSTKYGPFGGSEHAILEVNETNTIQSLLSLKDTYDFRIHVGDIGVGPSSTTCSLSLPRLSFLYDSANFPVLLRQYADYFLRESVQGLSGSTTRLRNLRGSRWPSDTRVCRSRCVFLPFRPFSS
jgi:hypothetical protein